MLIKDLEVEVVERTIVDSKGQRDVKVHTISGKVIIKRDGEYYTVSLVKSGEDLDFEMMMLQYLHEASQVDKLWELIKEPLYDDYHGRVIVNEKIKL